MGMGLLKRYIRVPEDEYKQIEAERRELALRRKVDEAEKSHQDSLAKLRKELAEKDEEIKKVKKAEEKKAEEKKG